MTIIKLKDFVITSLKKKCILERKIYKNVHDFTKESGSPLFNSHHYHGQCNTPHSLVENTHCLKWMSSTSSHNVTRGLKRKTVESLNLVCEIIMMQCARLMIPESDSTVPGHLS